MQSETAMVRNARSLKGGFVGDVPHSGKFVRDAETFCSASATLDHISGRLQPSQGGRRTLWWNGRGEDATATPPQKKHNYKATTGRGMAPSSRGRACVTAGAGD